MTILTILDYLPDSNYWTAIKDWLENNGQLPPQEELQDPNYSQNEANRLSNLLRVFNQLSDFSIVLEGMEQRSNLYEQLESFIGDTVGQHNRVEAQSIHELFSTFDIQLKRQFNELISNLWQTTVSVAPTLQTTPPNQRSSLAQRRVSAAINWIETVRHTFRRAETISQRYQEFNSPQIVDHHINCQIILNELAQNPNENHWPRLQEFLQMEDLSDTEAEEEYLEGEDQIINELINFFNDLIQFGDDYEIEPQWIEMKSRVIEFGDQDVELDNWVLARIIQQISTHPLIEGMKNTLIQTMVLFENLLIKLAPTLARDPPDHTTMFAQHRAMAALIYLERCRDIFRETNRIIHNLNQFPQYIHYMTQKMAQNYNEDIDDERFNDDDEEPDLFNQEDEEEFDDDEEVEEGFDPQDAFEPPPGSPDLGYDSGDNELEQANQ